MAEVAGQGKDPHARIGALQLAQEVQRDIAAAVVDIDEFEVEPGDGVQCSDEAAMGLADGRFLVEAGDDDGQERPGATSVGGEYACSLVTFATEPLVQFRIEAVS